MASRKQLECSSVHQAVNLVVKSKVPPPNNPRRPSRKLTPQDAAIIKRWINEGQFQSRIAAAFDVSPGRISEIKTGKKFVDIPPAP